jgi:hypothetical protein
MKKVNTIKTIAVGTLYLFIFFSGFLSAAPLPQEEIYTREAMLKAIEVFENDPLGQEGGMVSSIIINYSEESEEVDVNLSAYVLPWIIDKGLKNAEYKTLLMTAYVAGNIKSQLIKETKKNDYYAGLLLTIKMYFKLKAFDPSFYHPELEKLAKMEAEKKLKPYLDQLVK